MWPDNETTDDLLGFRVHSDLVLDVVTDPSLLPAVVGVFGDWGGGKSSIMRMLQARLEGEAYSDVACIYFNGWMFEGYEDAKTALLTSILVEIGDNKRFGPKARDGVVGLLKRVQWMEVGKLAVKHVGVPLAVAAMTGGVGAIPAAAASALHLAHAAGAAGKDHAAGSKEAADKKDENWLDKVIASPAKPDLLEVRKFREDFEKLLAETDIESLVVIIDDLDRCLPDRIIDTLEAIKLFVAVPKTAFVIGADPRIVRHAIASRYASRQLGGDPNDTEQYDLVRDYLEKLIQIPYHLPRLSPAEMESYINLLHCQKHLEDGDRATVLTSHAGKRQSNCYTAFGLGDVKAALGRDLPPELDLQLAWSNAVALPLTEGLKGNPRQVKRMLNAMVLRSKLAKIAGLEIQPEVLAKLMVLEYTLPERFAELDAWQTAQSGFPEQVSKLEREGGDVPPKGPAEDPLQEWRKPRAASWVRMEPALADVDLRDYFWIARDRTKSTLSAASLVSPLVSRLFRDLIGDNDGARKAAVTSAKELDDLETERLLGLLTQQVSRHPDQANPLEAFRLLSEAGIAGAAAAFCIAVRGAGLTLAASAPSKLELLAKAVPGHRSEVVATLQAVAKNKESAAGRAAELVLGRLK